MSFLDKYIESLALPSLLIGLIVSALLTYIPSSSNYIILICGTFLILITIYWIAIRITNRLIPRRFANFIYALDDNKNLAIIFHQFYNRYQPPGSRLKTNEAPHLAVERVMSEELGLNKEDYELISEDKDLPKYGDTQIVPKPFLVKSELGPHRRWVKEHYAFVYICKVRGTKPQLSSSLNPRWMNIEELLYLSENDVKHAPWGDVIPTYTKVLDFLRTHER